MNQIEKVQSLSKNLPDAEGSCRFFSQLNERHPTEAKKLLKNESLLSDVLAIAAFSPLLSTTLLQNSQYITWLARQRSEIKVRSKEEILESLARFSLTSSEVEPQILLSRFRRRELLSIYLRDIRHLVTISETTEEISNLADAILEYALRLAKQELDNRYGIPLEIDEKQRAKPASFCIISLGKLGSKELNYSSDIDLLFLYSTEGKTSGQGTKGAVTNREYFVKLSEFVTKLVGQQTGEGAAYRVDLRLRPHGRVGALAIPLFEAQNYYKSSAQAWERQTLIRSRASAGDAEMFKNFYSQVEANIYPTNETVESALQNVKLSKDKINVEQESSRGFNVKLGRGGIREIEFIAQALQIAYGGKDSWLRTPHTLISLSRLADRELLTEKEMNELFDAYEFLRRLEHRLQMEHGLQTHVVPEEAEKRLIVAKRMNLQNVEDFNNSLIFHTSNVSRIFEGVFGNDKNEINSPLSFANDSNVVNIQPEQRPDLNFSNTDFKFQKSNQILKNIFSAFEKSEKKISLNKNRISTLEKFCQTSSYFGEMIAANPSLVSNLPTEDSEFQKKNYSKILLNVVNKQNNFRDELADLRVEWTKLFLEIAASDVFHKIDFAESKKLQTELAEASLTVALQIAQNQVFHYYNVENQLPITNHQLPFAVLGLGKLGSRGMDYGSDLDLVLIYEEEKPLPIEQTYAEFYSRFVEVLLTTISSFTREGHLYRVDLRLRPDGKNGATSLGKNTFLNYLQTRSAIWEWLAYVKLRGVSGDFDLASKTENQAREIVHSKAQNANIDEIIQETLRLRQSLEKEKTRSGKDVNIKFSQGGLLDIYFATRFLQLRDNVQDETDNRSTQDMLKKLFQHQSLNEENFAALFEGHKFLSRLDHNLRLTVGRSNRIPLADKSALQTISNRMNLNSISDLFEKLSLHRMEIRSAFEEILK